MVRLSLCTVIACLLFLSGCDSKETQNKATQSTPATKESTVTDQIKDSAKNVTNTLKEEGNALKDSASNAANQVVESTKETTQKVAKKIEETTNDLANRLEESAKKSEERLEKVAAEVKEALPKPTRSEPKVPAKAKVCASCHGENGEKVALGKSKIMNQLSKQEIIDALKGYQDGTYGGSMKAVMLGQVKNLTTEEIEELASFYSAK